MPMQSRSAARTDEQNHAGDLVRRELDFAIEDRLAEHHGHSLARLNQHLQACGIDRRAVLIGVRY